MAPALVLNATYEPIAVVTAKRAIILVLTDKAVVVEAGDDEWRSATMAVPVPVVVRLRYYVRIPYRTRAALTRKNLLARDGHRCAYCPTRLTATSGTIDHVVPRSKGGPHRWENVVAACAPCNARKKDRTLAQLGWTLPFTPRTPHGTGWLVVGVTDRVPEEWGPYLSGVDLAATGA